MDNHFGDNLSFPLIFSSLLWMGFIVHLAFFLLLLDISSSLSLRLSRGCGAKLPQLSAKTKRSLALFVAIVFSVYCYVEAKGLEVERYEIYTNKLPLGQERVKILNLSDVHFGPVMREDKLKLIAEVWLKERPDLVVSTGDLADGNMKKRENIAKALAELPAPLGKFAVLGNHEFYRGVENSVSFTEKAGFQVLRGRWIDLGAIAIAGLDDPACQYFKSCVGLLDEAILLKGIPRDKFVILLKHRPTLSKEALGHFDLMLAGHLHGGLYKPVGNLLRMFYLTERGVVKKGGSYIIVSKGVGGGGPPMRFLSSPDVIVVELIRDP